MKSKDFEPVWVAHVSSLGIAAVRDLLRRSISAPTSGSIVIDAYGNEPTPSAVEAARVTIAEAAGEEFPTAARIDRENPDVVDAFITYAPYSARVIIDGNFAPHPPRLEIIDGDVLLIRDDHATMMGIDVSESPWRPLKPPPSLWNQFRARLRHRRP
jgi:hypothetical protein